MGVHTLSWVVLRPQSPSSLILSTSVHSILQKLSSDFHLFPTDIFRWGLTISTPGKILTITFPQESSECHKWLL